MSSKAQLRRLLGLCLRGGRSQRFCSRSMLMGGVGALLLACAGSGRMPAAPLHSGGAALPDAGADTTAASDCSDATTPSDPATPSNLESASQHTAPSQDDTLDLGGSCGAVQQTSYVVATSSVPLRRPRVDLSTLPDSTRAALLGTKRSAYHTPSAVNPRTSLHFEQVHDFVGMAPRHVTQLSRRHFTLTPRMERDGYQDNPFTAAYQAIFSADLPLYVSVDSLLFAVANLYEDTMMHVEEELIVPALRTALQQWLTQLPTLKTNSETRSELELAYRGALALLDKEPLPLAKGPCQAGWSQMEAVISTGEGEAEIGLFGTTITVAGQEFVPRGHYSRTAVLSQYWRTVHWLRLLPLQPLVATADPERLRLHPHTVELLSVMHDLEQGQGGASMRKVHRLLTRMVAPAATPTVSDAPPLLDAFSTTTLSLESNPNEFAEALATPLRAIAKGSLVADIEAASQAPQRALPRFSAFGHLDTPDTGALRAVTWEHRRRPDPLDAAFALFENDAVLDLVPGFVTGDEHARRLALSRAHLRQTAGNESVLDAWMTALRQLSQKPTLADGVQLPPVARSEAWGRRLLEAQLASWSEYRHAMALYAERGSYGIGCSHPDVYVDPYPDFYRALHTVGERLTRLLHFVEDETESVEDDEFRTTYLQRRAARLQQTALLLERIAKQQLQGAHLTKEQLAIFNKSVTAFVDCSQVSFPEWYVDIGGIGSTLGRVVAAVFDSTDESGTTYTLHTGTGQIRWMTVLVPSPAGPRLFVGPVSTLHQSWEKETLLTDERWQKRLSGGGYDETPTQPIPRPSWATRLD